MREKNPYPAPDYDVDPIEDQFIEYLVTLGWSKQNQLIGQILQRVMDRRRVVKEENRRDLEILEKAEDELKHLLTSGKTIAYEPARNH